MPINSLSSRSSRIVGLGITMLSSWRPLLGRSGRNTFSFTTQQQSGMVEQEQSAPEQWPSIPQHRSHGQQRIHTKLEPLAMNSCTSARSMGGPNAKRDNNVIIHR